MPPQSIASSETDDTIAQQEDLRQITLSACPSLSALTLRVTLLAEPWASLPFNAIGLRVASRVLASAPARLRVLTIAIALDGDASTTGAFLRPLSAKFDEELTWVRHVDEAHPALREVRWMWSYARKIGKPRPGPVDRQLREALVELVKERLPELERKSMLKFVNGDENIWG